MLVRSAATCSSVGQNNLQAWLWSIIKTRTAVPADRAASWALAVRVLHVVALMMVIRSAVRSCFTRSDPAPAGLARADGREARPSMAVQGLVRQPRRRGAGTAGRPGPQ